MSRGYSDEVREGAVREFAARRHEFPSKWAAVTAVAAKYGMTGETLRKWIHRAEVDGVIEAVYDESRAADGGSDPEPPQGDRTSSG